jgi:dienelactone hydrolase
MAATCRSIAQTENHAPRVRDSRAAIQGMKRQLSALVSFAVLSAISLAFPPKSRGQTLPPIGGGYTDVIAIPVTDPAIKAIGGALFKPAGAGPFPAIIYMPGCGGIDPTVQRTLQTATIEHLRSKGVATLIVDSFTPRNEPKGVCANLGNLDGERATQYATRDGNDALAAVAVLKAMPEINAKHIFLIGFSLGGTSSLRATDTKNPASRGAGVAGVIAYYPFCYDGVDPSVPVLALVGEKDDWTPAAKCQAVTGKSNFELIVYPGMTHSFATPFPKPVDILGHQLVYDEKAAQDAQQRADVFMAAQMK